MSKLSVSKLSALAVVAVLTTSVALTAAPAFADTSTTTRLSGSNGGGRPLAAAAFGAWRGTPDTIVNNFLPDATWDSFVNPPVWGGPDSWALAPIRVSWAVPMFPKTGGSLVAGARGDYDRYFAALAAKLIADNQANAIIRLGWEMNATWFSWSGVTDPQDWVTLLAAHRAGDGAVPGQQFVFDWAPNDDVAYDSAQLYPGDDFVDEVGMSVYDQSGKFTPDQQQQRWNELYNGAPATATQPATEGLAWLVQFAADHNKPMAFGEWGLSQRCDGTGGNDDPSFIQNMHDFFAQNNVAWETYFDLDPRVATSACEYHSLTAGHFPQAAALYRQLWTADAATTDVALGNAAITSTFSAADPDPALPETSLAIGLPAVAAAIVSAAVVLRRRRSRHASIGSF